ncbi:MAG: hypothetical protein ACO29Q_04750 [Crocinitomicaceae bacterium]|jgi:hypothetical protein
MRVLIDNKLTYETGKLTVKLGDTVKLPALPWMEEPYEGTVTHLESNYDGPCKFILEIVNKQES